MRNVLFFLLMLVCSAFVADHASAATAARVHTAEMPPLDFAVSNAALQLRSALSPYHAPDGQDGDDSVWYIMTAANSAARPVTRILLAEEPADAALHVFPRSTRPRILQLASSDGGVTVERQPAFGRYAYRVTIPPATTAALALRIANADQPPLIQAWTEPALIDFHHRLAVFVAVVAGLIAAAAAITGGAAAMSDHAVSRWAAVTLIGVFLVWLSTNGLFDYGWDTAIGGPYGFMAMMEGLTLAAAVRMTDEVAPLSDLWPWAERYRRWGLIGLVALSILAFVGIPGATLVLNPFVVIAVAGLAAYLVRRGAAGLRMARVLAPSAAIFALVALAAAIAAFDGFHNGSVSARIVGGFAAAGAVLLALAVATAESLGLLRVRRSGAQMRAGTLTPELVAAGSMSGEPQRGDGRASMALAAIGASHQGIYDLDFRADALWLSAEAAALIGYTKGALSIGHSSWIGRLHAEDRAIYKEALQDYRNHPGLAFRIEFRVRSQSGRYPWLELRATMAGEREFADRCLGLVADVTTRKEAEAALIDRPLHDPLTGLGNRAALMDALQRLERRPADITFVVLDIDRFKTIHASLGDIGADTILQHVAERLTTRYAGSADIFRIGGDSFALLFRKAGYDAVVMGRELVDLCGVPFIENGRRVFAPASVGVARGLDVGEPLDLLRNAELAMRLAKRQGGACARVYSVELDGSGPEDAVALEAELRHALEQGELDVFYQPIIRLSDRSVAGFEALLRWHHPERGLVWPTDFVGHSEESGLIVTLGRFALARAAEDLERWQRSFPLDPPLFVSVNVSRRQLLDSAFEEHLAEVLKSSGLADGSLRLEITESAVAASENAERRLAHIHDMGAGLAIDDFGTGLSTLSQLKTIPFDFVKVDKSFLAGHGEGSPDAEVILSSIVSLAHDLKRGIVVEGVESEEDAVWLAQMGCEFAQGFHFSVPLPAREAVNFIALHQKGRTSPDTASSATASS